MNVSLATSAPLEIECDVLVVGFFASAPLSGPAAEFNQATSGLLARLLDAKEVSGKRYELTLLLAPNGVKARLVMLVGLGEEKDFNLVTAFRAAAAAAKDAAGKERPRIAFAFQHDLQPALAEAAVAGSIVGCTGADLYRTKKSRYPFAEIIWSGISAEALEAGKILGEATNLTRRLVNEPPSVIFPESFANQAVEMAGNAGLEIEVWDHARLEQERCGSLLAVAKGSAKAPRLVIITYRGGPAGQAPLALVGKGVTFDSGGLSIKPTDGMKTMKCDMAGAATVVGAMQAIAKLKLPVNVIGLCGLVENMLGADAYKLGDVLHSRNGKTIEVLNTDAEGRLVLADVLDVCLERQPSHIIDLATLTGACVVALGTDVAGLMTNNNEWGEAVRKASETTGEPLWPLPMFPEFGEQIRSEIADIKNVGDGRWGGAMTAGKFLEEFVGGKPWVHLDIAGPAFYDSPRPWCDAGGSGMYVRTLVEIARRMAGG